MNGTRKWVGVSWMAVALLPLLIGVAMAVNTAPPQTNQTTEHDGQIATTPTPGQLQQFQPKLERAKPPDAEAFAALLRQRYGSTRRMMAACGGLHHDGPPIDASRWTDNGQKKWALAGLIVLWTARQWQQHPSAFPCRLVED